MLQLGSFTNLASLFVFTGILLLLSPSAPVMGEMENDQLARQSCLTQLPLDKLAEPLKAKLTQVIKQAQLFERGKTEAFPCNPEIYRWLLESPDASLYAWKKLGATKASINRLENGTFLGTDGMGGELRWRLVATGPLSRIWFAEGSGRIGPLLPTMTIRAIVFLNFQEVKGVDGRVGIKHRLEMLVHYDSNALINKLTNMSAESAGKKAIQQMELFFSGMAWYVSEHANWSRATFNTWATTPETKDRLQQLLPKLEPIVSTSAEVPAPGK